MTTTELQSQIDTLFAELQWPAATAITPMHGDASARRYFRVQRGDDASVVLMVMPSGASSAAEEITNFRGASKEPPFIAIANILREIEILVPAILHHSPERRWILLEDVGDLQFLDVVRTAESTERVAWYRAAIELMIQLQERTVRVDPSSCIAMQRSFDETLLNWEFDHFLEFALKARGQKLTEKFGKDFERITRALTEDITSLPYGFTHRDFQSRNLMVFEQKLVLLDFQDALRGPYVYDLVSLLRDSYIALAPDELDHLVAYYAARKVMPPATVRAHFDLVTTQRKMKDAGRFVYIDQVKKNPNFMQYLPTTLQYVREALQAIPRGRDLFTLLLPHVPEWQDAPAAASGTFGATN